VLVLALLIAALVHIREERVFSNLAQTTDDAGIPNSLGRIATDFQTSAVSGSLEGITLKLRNSDSITHTITASLFTDVNDAPGSLISSFPKLTLASKQASFSVHPS
jgi:hypothetical protein